MNPDVENEDINVKAVELKDKIDSVSNMTNDEYEENGMRKISVSNSFDYEQTEVTYY